MTVSSLATITSSYNHLNGIDAMMYDGYGGYGMGFGGYGMGFGGVWGKANAEHAKQRVADNYEVNATWQGYRSKQGVESANYTQQCLLIAEDLKKGETDQVAERFEDMVNAMKRSPQYANYSDSEICSLIRSQYATATGSDLVIDINKNASGAFIQGVKRSIPIFGLMVNKYSKADLVSLVTENSMSKSEKASKTLGYVTGAAAGTSAIAAVVGLAYKNFDKISGLCTTAVKWVEEHVIGKGNAKYAAIGVAAVTGLAALASLFSNHHKNKISKDG